MTKPPRLFSALLLWCLVPAAPTSAAQPGDERVEVEPIRCWWRTDAGEVRVGQPFSVVLTCAALQTSAARAIVDESRLDPAVVQLPPFDVLGGTRARDLVTSTRRFIQLQYTLRVIGDVFGGEVAVPSLQLTYRIENRAGTAGIQTAEGDVVHGRDLTYAMPSLPLRVISMVPDSAIDIREAPAVTFQQIERAGFRATVLRVLAIVFFATAVLLAASALLPVVRRRGRSDAGATAVSDRAILAGAGRALTGALEQARLTGWSHEGVGRVLAALRIAAAYAAGHPVSRARAEAEATARDGELLVRTRTGSALVSAATTAAAIRERPDLEDLRDALERFTAARYGRDGDAGALRLEEALDRAIQVVERLAGGYSWRARRAAALRKSVTGARERLWAR